MIAAGDALVGSVDPADGEVLLALPGGARGTALPPAELAGLIGQVGCWREVAGISDGLLALPGETGRGRAGGGRRPGRAVARRGAARQLDRAVRLAGGRPSR